MPDSSFIGYVGNADFHDGSIVSVEQHDGTVSVRVRGASGKLFVVDFRGITSPPNKALHLPGPALRFFETSLSLQPARQVNAVVRRTKGSCVFLRRTFAMSRQQAERVNPESSVEVRLDGFRFNDSRT